MILIPEIETVVILTPRTGSGSLYREVAERYPRSMKLYRHMEADGVPAGYNDWRYIGVVREPVARLFSLYKFMKTMAGDHDPDYLAGIHASVQCSFEDWLLNNETVFTTPDMPNGFNPLYSVKHETPENRKTQWTTLRPDFGTQIFQFNKLHELAEELDLSLDRVNRRNTTYYTSEPPALSFEAIDHIHRYFEWDMEVTREQS